MGQLSDDVHGRVVDLCEKGDRLMEERDLSGAMAAYERALELLPDPKEDWEAATWILTALGDAYFQRREHAKARDTLTRAMRCPGAIGNPFVHLRLGQAHLELKEIDRAKDELARAYMGGGDEIFAGEDPKFGRFIKEILRPREDI